MIGFYKKIDGLRSLGKCSHCFLLRYFPEESNRVRYDEVKVKSRISSSKPVYIAYQYRQLINQLFKHLVIKSLISEQSMIAREHLILKKVEK